MRKLIRDRIPEIIQSKWEVANITLVEDWNELFALLLEKVLEEAQEVVESQWDPSEIADLMEVLMSLTKFQGIAWDKIESIRREKLENRGRFEQWYILHV